MDKRAAKFMGVMSIDAVAARWKSLFLKTVQIDADLPVSLSLADVMDERAKGGRARHFAMHEGLWDNCMR